jgi:hypothetical protein
VSDAAAAGLQALCKSCGLCCDGSLFGRVALEPEETERARAVRLHLVAGDRAFTQPCAVLVPAPGGRACAIYQERPRRCHHFTCRLYARHAREGGPLEPRLAVVRRVRELLKVVAGGTSRGAHHPAELEELRRRLDEDFARE